MSFDRLIRFVAEDGRIVYGEPQISSAEELRDCIEKGSLKAEILDGIDGAMWPQFQQARQTGRIVTVKQLLGPLHVDSVPIIRCIGLNYMKHSERSSFMLFQACCLPACSVDSPGRRPLSTSLPIFLHQAVCFGHRLGRRHQHSKGCTRPPA